MSWIYVIYTDVLAQYTHVLVLHIHTYLLLNNHHVYYVYPAIHICVYYVYPAIYMCIELQVDMYMKYEYMCILREYIWVYDVYPAHVKHVYYIQQYTSNNIPMYS